MRNKYLLFILIFSFKILSSQLKFVETTFHKKDFKIFDENSETEIKKFLKIDSNINLILLKDKTFNDELGYTHYTYSQEVNSIPVEFSVLKLHFLNNSSIYLNGNIIFRSVENRKILLKEEEAFKLAMKSEENKNFSWENNEFLKNKKLKQSNISYVPKGVLVYFSNLKTPKAELELTYRFDIHTLNPEKRVIIYVSTINGEIISKISKNCTGTAETLYNGTKTILTSQVPNTNPPYILKNVKYFTVVHTTKAYGNDAMDNDDNWLASECIIAGGNTYAPQQYMLDVQWGTEQFLTYFMLKFNRNSIDNNNADLLSECSGGNDDAGWVSDHANFSGGWIMNPFATVDIVAHEFAHGLCEKTCDLVYSYEQGAINESLSDIWGACVENYSSPNRQTWLVGDGVPKNKQALRSMSNPKAESHPDTYQGTYWATSSNDNGGVHTNSGVMNYWFYLLSVGGNGTNDKGHGYSVTGITIDKAAKIVYRAETVYFTSTTNFFQARQLTIRAAKDIFGVCSEEVKNVINAWYAVGVGVSFNQSNSIYINTDLNSYENDYKYAFYKITALNNIESDAIANYESSKTIELVDGFHAKSGCVLSAKIVPCSNSNGGYKTISNFIQEKNNNVKEIDFNVNIYPNPFTEYINVNFERKMNSKIKIFNSSGQVLLETQLENKENIIYLNDIPLGVLYLNISSNNINKNFKIIKIR